MRCAALTASIFVLFAAPAANAMSVSTFMAKAAKLEAKGPFALLSSDMGVLRTELERSGAELRQQRLAAVKAGKTPVYCPTSSAGQMTVEEILGAMRAIPVADRSRSTVKDALRSHLARKFPCPA